MNTLAGLLICVTVFSAEKDEFFGSPEREKLPATGPIIGEKLSYRTGIDRVGTKGYSCSSALE